MAKITTRAAGLGACAVLLGGLATAAPAVAGATAGAAVAGPAARPGVAARPARAGATGWRRYRVPVKGQANLDAAAAPGRDDAWAGGFTIHNSSSSARGRRAGGSSAGGLRLSRLTASGLSAAGLSVAGHRAAGTGPPGGRPPAAPRVRSSGSSTRCCCTGTAAPGAGCPRRTWPGSTT